MGFQMRIKSSLVLFISISFMIILNACGSSEFVKELSLRDRFNLAVKQYQEGSYDKSIENLRVISYDRGSGFADSVQYILAECYFMREQYLIASAEYRDLIRFNTNSSLVPSARFKVALALSKISPKFDLDQNYTNKAIIEFQNFIEYYPTNEKVREAEKNITELRNKLAYKDYETASLYRINEHYRSALVYYQGILEKYHDSEYADLADFGVIEIYILQNKYALARTEIDKFLQKYINSSKIDKVTKLKKEIENK